jgi:hypothetical protein
MTTPEPEQDLHRLMDDAVSGVNPHGRPADVRAAAAGHRGSHTATARRWVPLTLAAAVATVAVIGGTAWFADQDHGDPTVSGPTAPQRSNGTDQDSSSTAPGNPVQVPAYYAGEAAAGPRLFHELHSVNAQGRDALQVAVDEALTRPPNDPDYRPSALVGATAKVTAEGGLITIDLSDVPVGSSAGGEIALQALVWTADAATGTDAPVQFLRDGDQVDDLLGVDTSRPLARASSDSVLSPVTILTPGDDARLPTRFDVTGEAATFEGNVVWELKRGATVVRSGYTTTQEAGVQSPYAFQVSATPGDYLLVVHDTDESGGEGVGITQDTREISVRNGF